MSDFEFEKFSSCQILSPFFLKNQILSRKYFLEIRRWAQNFLKIRFPMKKVSSKESRSLSVYSLLRENNIFFGFLGYLKRMILRPIFFIKNHFWNIFFGKKIWFWIKIFSYKIKFWIKNLTECQILKDSFDNVPDFELKLSEASDFV